MSNENESIEKKDCMICCQTKKKFVNCLYCGNEACLDCHEKYLLEKINPKCMSCGKDWTYNYLREKFPKNFINKTYRNYKEGLLFDLEKNLLPEIQDEVAFEKQYEEEYETLLGLIKKYKDIKKMRKQTQFSDEKEIYENEDIKDSLIFLLYLKKTNSNGNRSNNISKRLKNYNKLSREEKGWNNYSPNDLRYIDLRSEIRDLESMKRRIQEILKNGVDYRLLNDVFKRNFNLFNISYNKYDNSIIGDYHFYFSEHSWGHITEYFKKKFKIEIEKPPFKEGEIFELIFSFYLKENEGENILVFECNNKIYEACQPLLLKFLKSTIKNKKVVFNRPCPLQNCRGFFGQDFKCGLCEAKICKECHEVIEEKKEEDEEKIHKCNPDTIANVKMIQKDSKPCPKCNVLIFKTMGCAQVWCTQCHTAFDWKTGEIETGRIHNPHYWEFLRQQGKEEGEVNRIFGNGENEEKKREDVNQNCFTFDNLEYYLGETRFNIIFNLVNHLQEVILPKYRVQNLEERNKDLRKLYLHQKIDEKEFKSKLIARFKKNNFNMEMTQILEMFIQTIKDSFILFFLRQNIRTKIKDIINYIDEYPLYLEMKELHKYLITNVKKVCDVYDYVFPVKSVNCLEDNYFEFLNTYYHDREKTNIEIKDYINFYKNGLNCLLEGGLYFEPNLYQPKPRIYNRSYFNSDKSFEDYRTEKINEFVKKIEDLSCFLKEIKRNETTKEKDQKIEKKEE